MNTFTTLKSKMIPLLINNIDTDQIIPARYLKVTEKASVAAGLFSDWRYLEDGTPNPDFVLNKPEYQGARILLAGDNFGCGSSREHAPWALVGSGIQAIISTSFADIFKNNALKNGLLPITVDAEMYQNFLDLIEEVPSAEIYIDLESQTVALPDGSNAEFGIDPFAKKCLLSGMDQLGYILSFTEKIQSFESTGIII
ncbi:MAG: 3-isopropylmalate dehydratase small subunit [Anaerolineales bacterium]|nr:3-isopropylmalate dehydratase small subunit [Anaerolineales bacterium]